MLSTFLPRKPPTRCGAGTGRRAGTRFILCCLLNACSSRPGRPPGPPPEYERPAPQHWEAGVATDPFEHIEEAV
ncbi:MAG TPA: hypothetical protein VGJ84_12825, partial [Polyangiaceae bacterium]